jgi:type I restriction-modification system DNA methylase subunit
MTTGLLNPPMKQFAHNKLVSFIWSIADDCLRDVYVRGKYRDVILPMVGLRRLDTLLEPTKAAVLEEVRFQKDEMKATELDDAPLIRDSRPVRCRMVQVAASCSAKKATMATTNPA